MHVNSSSRKKIAFHEGDGIYIVMDDVYVDQDGLGMFIVGHRYDYMGVEHFDDFRAYRRSEMSHLEIIDQEFNDIELF